MHPAHPPRKRPSYVFTIAAVLLIPIFGCEREGPAPEADLETRARAIHESVISIDTHDDISSNFATAESDPGQEEGRQVTLPRMRAGGLDVAFFIVYVGQSERTEENYAEAKAEALPKFEAIHRLTDEMYPDEIGLALTPDDVERLHAEGKLVAAIGIENGFSIGTDLSLMEEYHARGAR
ncbi:MAG: membrane dipeptidase, partial [Gemmatimonadetes bacterium]|nr:membrane dipeptidase [Gemmatimonadota bacterium]